VRRDCCCVHNNKDSDKNFGIVQSTVGLLAELSDEDSLMDENSAQYRSATWIPAQDSTHLDPESDRECMIERYVLAALCYRKGSDIPLILIPAMLLYRPIALIWLPCRNVNGMRLHILTNASVYNFNFKERASKQITHSSLSSTSPPFE